MAHRATEPATENGQQAIARTKPWTWLAALALFLVVFLVAHQRPHVDRSADAWTGLIGSAFVWAGVLPWLVLWWLVAAGYGGVAATCLFRSSFTTNPEREKAVPGLALALGGATLLLLTWLTQWLVGLNRITMTALLAFGVALLLWQHRDTLQQKLRNGQIKTPPLPWPALLLTPPLALLAAAVTLPAGTLWQVEAFGYDVLSYHLNLPKQWLSAGAMTATPHDVYGYLPNLVESSYALLFALRGSAAADTVYLAQGFHASWALLAAAQVGLGVFDLTRNRLAAWTAAALLLAVPWVLITGSLAYNEMAALTLGAAAWRVVSTPAQLRPWARGVTLGLLVGAATLAKLTGGFMIAVPLGLVLAAAFLWKQPRETLRASLASAVVAAVVGTAVLGPYLLRNAQWTGNPVFPFAAQQLGSGHWDDDLVERWNRGHGLNTEHDDHAIQPDALRRHWLQNAGYGALGGEPSPIETRNIAQFPRQFGVPVLWPAVLLGLVGAMFVSRWRGAGVVLVLWLLWQLLCWHVLTHQQSRFLITTLVPGVLLVGLGLGAWAGQPATNNRRQALSALLGVLLVLTLTYQSLQTLWTQTKPRFAEGADGRVTTAEPHAPPWYYADSLAATDGLPHPVNTLPPSSCVLVVADTSQLFYLEPELVYASAFDASPLGDVIETAGGEPDALVRELNQRGITHLWIGWSELRRLHGTYGHDPRVTESVVRTLIRGWPVVIDARVSTLVAVPKRR